MKLIISTPSRRTLREQTPESESRVGHPKNLFVEPFLALAQNDNHVSVSWCCFSRTAFPERSAVNKSHENLFDSATAHYVGRRWIGGRRRKSAADFRDLPQSETSLSSSVRLSPVRAAVHQIFIRRRLCHTSLKRSTAFVNSLVSRFPCHISRFYFNIFHDHPSMFIFPIIGDAK